MYSTISHRRQVCSGCGQRVLPRLRLYRKAPDAFICPRCARPLGTLKSSVRREHRILWAVLSFSGVLFVLSLLL